MMRMRKGQLSIALVCVVLGIMLAVQFRATQGIRSNVTYQRIEDLSAQLKAIEKETGCLAPKVLYDIYNTPFNKTVWSKEEMEEKLIKLIGEIDENC